ncbi:hypothetical protein AB4120_18390, partial [Cupriavidus sp. 2KB_3]|uniref:hypothetical protein n=1 Tax=Cupriavidus sp. 2KB_3 TaxID=3232980 RepID=UPI003F8DA004
FRCGQRCKTAQPDHPSTPQPLSLLRLQRGLCCEGTNSRRLMAGWQAISQNNSKVHLKLRLRHKTGRL